MTSPNQPTKPELTRRTFLQNSTIAAAGAAFSGALAGMTVPGVHAASLDQGPGVKIGVIGCGGRGSGAVLRADGVFDDSESGRRAALHDVRLDHDSERRLLQMLELRDDERLRLIEPRSDAIGIVGTTQRKGGLFGPPFLLSALRTRDSRAGEFGHVFIWLSRH